MKNTCLIGIDLGATNVRVARIEDGEIVVLSSEAIAHSNKPDNLIDQVKRMIASVITEKVQGIGIGVPSVVDPEKGIVYNVQNIPSWEAIPLKEILEREFKVLVFINNDANCFVLGEKYFGQGIYEKSIVGLILGTGFGAGLVMNGSLVSGENCGAGEVGMLPYKDSIFEEYCSGQFFEIHKKLNGQQVFEAAKQGSENAVAMYQEFGTHLGNAMKAVIYAYDPGMIILGGSVKDAYRFFKKAMHTAMADFAYPKSLENLKIRISELDQVAVLGAAALSLDKDTPVNQE